jgi:hypothetical protein
LEPWFRIELDGDRHFRAGCRATDQTGGRYMLSFTIDFDPTELPENRVAQICVTAHQRSLSTHRGRHIGCMWNTVT